MSRSVNAPGTNDQSTPSELGAKKPSIFSFDWLKQEDYGTFTGEPPRVSLTDPPPGYQTPSPDQPYGIVPEKKIYKPPTLGRAYGAGAIGLGSELGSSRPARS